MAESIAIVGSACRFPGSASSPSKLWDLLQSPRDVLREFPSERLNLSKFYSEDGERHGSTDVKNCSYLLQEDCRLFDAAFFRVNPKEAHSMDPQQRILLETVFEALEAAGCPLDKIEGSPTSVYVGMMTSDFNDIQMRDPETLATYTATGLARSILSNRVSYFFDLKGPSMTIDTACSSSLVALHQAVQCLRNGDATQAIVAGTALLLDPSMYIAESTLHMLSPDSRSRMWDKDANGYARGEGCAAVFLKPLSKALLDHDHIECVIRETAVNSDGRTNGITMPNSLAQAALIRETYEKAGLDPAADRCQYFECHGTGTLAGDPVEARAIQEAFFPDPVDAPDCSPLYCGSIKTVIGHLEGCAGLAGVLKASLAIQNKAIPPNMHFKELNPAVAPFYSNLCVPTSLLPWPKTHDRVLRASVNSFGFGGTNAHAILESYEPSSEDAMLDAERTHEVSSTISSGLFVFSAKSRSSLLRILKDTAEHISQNPLLDLDALAWMLHSRRTAFAIRVAIAASNRQRLLDALEKHISAAEASASSPIGVRAITRDTDQSCGVLGIFTGQGAQYPSMGRELMRNCSTFRKSIEKCEEALKTIPQAPSWSLTEEITVEKAQSRVGEAQFSQPLCTAIQIALVDLLHAAKVKFDAVVGHSSGEIGAAYAAGILNVRDAMGIAYYRGLVAKLAKGDAGQKGGMLAVGMSFDDAISFCLKPTFVRRIGVAASNAPSTVTLSGDLDAIHEAKAHLDEGKVFARILKVDTAYHSHHMVHCADAYAKHLEQLGICVQKPPEGCIWSSSVHKDSDLILGRLDMFKTQYWVDNMVKPVLFSQALAYTIQQHRNFSMALEVGPHPALKGPVNQTIKSFFDSGIPYTGCMERGDVGVESISTALGLLWIYLGPSYLDFDGWRKAFDGTKSPRMLKDLPRYPWDHDQIYWHESRVSHNYRIGNKHSHELLGRLNEGSQYEMTWRNVLSLNEMEWVGGHRYQGQVIFPGAGYVSMAVQAAAVFVQGRAIKVVEIQDMKIPKAIVIDENSAGVETIFTVRSYELHSSMVDGSILEAEFICYSSPDQRVLDKSCDGRLLIHLGNRGIEELLPSHPSQAELPGLDVDRFYEAVARLGISYDGVFRTIRSVHKTRGHSKAFASWTKNELGTQYTLHPAILDVAFQAGIATFVSIAENAMGSTYLPAGIRRVIVDPAQHYRGPLGNVGIDIETHLTKSTGAILEVDINLWDSFSKAPGVQVDGLILKAVAEPLPADDRLLFAKTIWDVDAGCVLPTPPPAEITRDELEYINAVERTAMFFLQKLTHDVRPEEIRTIKWYHQQLFRAIEIFLAPVQQGRHAVIKKEWLGDSRDTILEFAKLYPNSVDLALLKAVGENLSSVIRGESEMLEHMLEDNLLGRIYMEGRGFAASNGNVAKMMAKISHKYPRTRILEIGAGTGGTTLSVFDAIGNAYFSYTYTDISAGFFEKAAEKFVDHSHKMDFKIFNAENPPSEQGFVEGSYDVVIAANVLHATKKLSTTMQNTRALLRPGGFLIAVEVTGTMLREPALMGGLEGWWLGVEDGRFPCPGISAKQWHDVLQESGFSGVDTIVYDMPDLARHNCSVFVTQAIDEKFELLRDPLASTDLIPETQVLIVGGKTLAVAKLVRQATKLIKRWTSDVTTCNDIDSLDPSQIRPGTSILCLAELDQAIFSEDVGTKRLENLQEMLGNAQDVLWLTTGRLYEDPYSNMMLGIGRALSFELPHVNLQFLDFDQQSSWDMEIAVQYLARLALLSSPQYLDQDMLWVQEPEVEVRGDTVLIPRVVRDDEANEVLNANRRQITKLVDESERVEVFYDKPKPRLVKAILDIPSENSTEITVELSLALNSSNENPWFLCFGYTQEIDQKVFALTNTNSSIETVSSESIFKPVMTSKCDASVLMAVSAALTASYLINDSPKQGTILIHEPTEGLEKAITEAAKQAHRKVQFLATTAERKRSDWIFVHPLARPRDVRNIICNDATILFSLANETLGDLWKCLPQNCKIRNLDVSFISHQQAALAAAYESATSTSAQPMPPIMSIESMSQDFSDEERSSVVLDWTRHGPLNVTVPPLDAASVFLPDKTYVLVGMTGELGQSLCRFMVHQGARHIVLCSRNPVVDSGWLSDMQMAGAEIRVEKMDVTDKAQVQATTSKIRKDLPKISGVVNAALVLEDTLFVNATAENVAKQLKPKVDGTVNLDDEFADDNLDFFIACSSLGSVFGNAGQSIYHAANMFMTSLVEQRRQRGQAGSVIDIGMIVDVGYVAKAERKIEEHLRSQFYTPLAETDFHHLVLQAALSGHPGSANADLIMGIQPFVDDSNASTKPHWYENPRFSHMILSPTAFEEPSKEGTSTKELRGKLEQAASVAEANEAFQELFCKKIELMTKIPVASIDVNTPLSDLGLDSLLAVEIRTWLLKDMRLDVPLLRILSPEPMASIFSSLAQEFYHARAPPTESNLIRSEKLNTLPQDIPTEPEDAAAAVPLERSNSTDISALSQSRTLDSQDSGSTRSFPSSNVTTPLDFSPNSELKSNEPEKSVTIVKTVAEINPTVSLCLEEPVAPLEYERIERMSFGQASLHFSHSFLDDHTSFNVTAQYEVKGQIRVPRFARALEKTLARHNAYRTCFFTESGSQELKQGIASNVPMDRFIHFDSTAPEDIDRVFETLAGREWNLSNAQTFQAVLITHGLETHTLFFGCHHIIMDGMSWHIFVQDLHRAYEMLPLKPVENDYMDFSRMQLSNLENGVLDESIAYWMRELQPIPSVLPLLPLAQTRIRKSQRTYGNHTIQRSLSAEKAQRIKQASQKCGATPMQFYLAVLQTLFARLLELDELCIGVTDAGRGDSDFAETIGFFTNLLPMKFSMNQDETFSNLLKETTRTVLNGYNHAQVPFDLILERLQIKRSTAYSPLFQVVFNYRIGNVLQTPIGNSTMDFVKFVDTKTPYDFSFNVTQAAQGSHLLQITSRDYLYSIPSTELVMDAYIHLLETLSMDQSTKVQNCKLYSQLQVEQALCLGRGSRIEHPWPQTLTERFHQVCFTFPESIAIKDDAISLTYNELNLQVNAIATTLLTRGVNVGTRVAVLCEPSTDTYAAMLAILHVGAVYVPLDISLPAGRHRAILEACNPKVLVFHSPTITAAAAQYSDGRDVVKLNLSELSDSTGSPPPFVASMGDDFLLFTSGSTGTPKGINLCQSGIMNYAASKSAKLGLDDVKVLQQSSTGFDMSIAQAFNAFANAGTLVIASSKTRGDPALIAQLMLKENIEFTICTPSEYLMLATYAADSLRQCKAWKYACSGGEAIADKLVYELERLELPDLTLTDCYGPTEISCAATFQSIPLRTRLEDTGVVRSVGKAILNTSIYILNDLSEALPPGYSGEICVGGSGVAKGYLDDELCAHKFVPDPFATNDDVSRSWTTMYRTGDKGYLRADGSLVFLGRMDGDTLVKLRGLRIELDEVANVILHNSRGIIADSVVTMRGEPEFLVAHVVFARGQNMSASELNTLRGQLPLPRYMIPSVIIPLSIIPTTPNGKVDRRALQGLSLPVISSNIDKQEPLTMAEGELRLIWRDVLGEAASSAKIHGDTDFFTVGGSSALLVRLQNSLKERMGVRVPLQELYQVSTLAKMAKTTSNERSQLVAETIDWEVETSIPDSVLETSIVSSTKARKHQQRHRQVILTGSTGFLGLEILRAMIRDSDIEKIHCIAISADAELKLPSDDKVIVYTGSLLSPHLGLSGREVEFLKCNVDQIVHAGAQGHCLNNYSSVKQANYLSTVFLATLALPRRVPLHFVSSGRVILQSGSCTARPVSMSAYPPPADGSQGFTASKWASEAFLEKVSHEMGLPVMIHRPCTVIGSGAPHDDAMNSIIRYSILSLKVPKVPNSEGFFDFKGVSEVAKEIASGPIAHESVSFRHHSSEVQVPLDQLAERMESLHGAKFEMVNLSEWLDDAVKLGIEDLIVSYLQANVANGTKLTQPYLGLS